MALTGLCSYEDVIARMADVGLASASDDPETNAELIGRKIIQSDADIELDLIVRVQKKIAPYDVDQFGNTPAQIVSRITAEAKAYLNQTAVTYTLRAIFEEGEVRVRFRYPEAGDTLEKALKRWDLKCTQEFEKVIPLLTFDQNGDGIITLFERLFMNSFSSIRISV